MSEGAKGPESASDPAELDFTKWLTYWPEPEVEFRLEVPTTSALPSMQQHGGGAAPGGGGDDSAQHLSELLGGGPQGLPAQTILLPPPGQLLHLPGGGVQQTSDYTFGGGVPSVGELHGKIQLGGLLHEPLHAARTSFEGPSTALLQPGSEFLLSMPSTAGLQQQLLAPVALQHHAFQHDLGFTGSGSLPPPYMQGQMFSGPTRQGACSPARRPAPVRPASWWCAVCSRSAKCWVQTRWRVHSP